MHYQNYNTENLISYLTSECTCFLFTYDDTRCNTYSMSFTKSFDIKSSASFDIVEKASSSKSYFPMVTLAIVVISVEPINGDKPDNLRKLYE